MHGEALMLMPSPDSWAILTLLFLQDLTPLMGNKKDSIPVTIWQLFMLQVATSNVHLQGRHISGKLNTVVDVLLRWAITVQLHDRSKCIVYPIMSGILWEQIT